MSVCSEFATQSDTSCHILIGNSMDVFASFKERAQASMREAMSTATVLASTAMENVKVRNAATVCK